MGERLAITTLYAPRERSLRELISSRSGRGALHDSIRFQS
jgi:hypothetical protein